jgi:hypothetical protein
MWQDLALSIIGVVFTIMLLPQLRDVKRGKLVDGKQIKVILNFWTCLITGIGLIVMGSVYATLNLAVASAVSFTTAAIWLLLMGYSERNRKNPISPTQYINPRAQGLPVRDQGERNTSAGMSAAAVMDLLKRENEELN